MDGIWYRAKDPTISEEIEKPRLLLGFAFYFYRIRPSPIFPVQSFTESSMVVI